MFTPPVAARLLLGRLTNTPTCKFIGVELSRRRSGAAVLEFEFFSRSRSAKQSMNNPA